MKTKRFFLPALAAALLPTALHAAEMSFEGRWLFGGTPQPSVDSTCEVRFYDAADAAAPAATVEGVPFKTDADGYFVVSAEVPAEMPDTFWAGVEPQGAGEISPRFRVAPVPFALAAGEAELVTNATQLALTGTATIERLTTTGDVEVDQWTVPSGGTIHARNLGLGSVRLTDLAMAPGGAVGLFGGSGGTLSADYDRLEASDGGEFSVANAIKEQRIITTFSLYTATPRSDSREWSFDRDGFLLVALKAEFCDVDPPGAVVELNGLAHFACGQLGVRTGSQTTVKRCLCIPYRAGTKVRVVLQTRGSDDAPYFTRSDLVERVGAKLRLVPFGRE